MIRIKPLLIPALAAAIALTGLTAARPASADAIYTLGVPNSQISPYPAPYGTVDVSLTDSTHATVTFTAAETGIYQYLFIDGSIADVNVNASTWSIGNFTQTLLNGSFKAPTLSDGGSGNVDGFGIFNQTVNSSAGYKYALSVVDFTLTDTGGSWANADSVLTPNSDGYSAAAHIAVCDTSLGTCAPSIAAVATGFAANSSAVPEPGTLALFGTALLGLAIAAERRRRA